MRNVFLPTCVQSFVAFYALNKIGVIANIVHPLTPPELLKETMDAVGSKGVMLMDLLAKQLNVTRGELKGLAEDGKITSKVMIEALDGFCARI